MTAARRVADRVTTPERPDRVVVRWFARRSIFMTGHIAKMELSVLLVYYSTRARDRLEAMLRGQGADVYAVSGRAPDAADVRPRIDERWAAGGAARPGNRRSNGRSAHRLGTT